MNRRTILSIRHIAVLLAALLLALSAAALAASPTLGIQAEADPDSFTVPGPTTLYYTLTNDSRKTIENICLVTMDGSVVETCEDLGRGKSLVIEHEHALTQEELNAGSVFYNISCTYEGVQYTYPAPIAVSIAASGPDLQLRRQISSQYAIEGQEITLVYQMKNVGGTDAVGIILRDRLGDFLVNVDKLSPGESYTASQHVAITEDASSRATLTWQDTASTPEVFNAELDQADILLVESSLTATLTAGRSMDDPDMADIVLTLTCEGPLPYEDLSIADELLGIELQQHVNVPAGGSIQIARTSPIRGDSDYCWRVEGMTPTGLPLLLVTDTATIYQTAESGEPALAITAWTDTEKISRKGFVEVHISLVNSGGAMARHVQIDEETRGEVFTFAAVPTGDPISHTFLTEIGEDTTLRYSASYSGPGGQRVTVYADPLSIAIGRGGAKPAQPTQPESVLGGITDRFQASPVLLIALVVAIVALVVLTLVLLVTSRRRKFHRRVRREASRQLRETAARTGKIDPIRPQRPDGEAKS